MADEKALLQAIHQELLHHRKIMGAAAKHESKGRFTGERLAGLAILFSVLSVATIAAVSIGLAREDAASVTETVLIFVGVTGLVLVVVVVLWVKHDKAAEKFADDICLLLDAPSYVPAPPATEGTPEPPPTAAQIRAWAQSDGLNVADRGPLPGHVIEAYHRAH